MVDARGHLWITDFGLARFQSEGRLSLTGDLVGTLRYMSPEQALAKRVVVDHRTDIYSLGATLYELLTLEPVFTGADREELLRQIALDEPRALRQYNKSIPAELETIVFKALEKNPVDRYATAKELADDLDRFVRDEPIQARPAGLARRCAKCVRRRPALAAAYVLAALTLMLAGLGGATAWLWRLAEEARDRAEVARGAADVARGDAEQALQKVQKARAGEAKAQQRAVAISNILLVHTALRHWEDHQVARARALLENCPADQRQWEWHYVNSLCNPELLDLKVGDGGRTLESGILSGDGKLLASPSDDKTVKVWDLTTGKQAITLTVPTDRVLCLALSPDGKCLASGGACGPWDRTLRRHQSGEVRLWDLATGQELLAFQKHDDAVFSVAFSSDGRHIASGSADRTVKVWEAATGQLTFSLAGHTDRVAGVAFSPNGKVLACAFSTTVKLWDLATGQEVRAFQGAQGSGLLTFSPDGRRVACPLAGNKDVRVWDLTNDDALLLHGHEDVSSIAFSPDGRRLATGGRDNTIKVWDLAAARKPEVLEHAITLQGHLDVVLRLAFSADGQRLISAANDKTVKVWDLTRSPEPRCVAGLAILNTGSALSPDGKHLAMTSGRGSRVEVLDLVSGKQTVDLNAGYVWGVAYSPDGRRLATASTSQAKSVKVWDLATRQIVFTLKGHADEVYCVAYSADGRRLASGSKDGVVRVWDAATGREIFTLRGHSGIVMRVAFSPDGKRLATCSWDKTVKLWDLETGQEAIALLGHEDMVQAVAFSPDGRLLASASSDQTIKLWDTTTGKEAHTLKGRGGVVVCVAFSPDGRRLASGSNDGLVKLWDPASGAEALALNTNAGTWVTSVAFSPDGWRLISTTCSGAAIIWDATPRVDQVAAGPPPPGPLEAKQGPRQTTD
jgi:WD40 repeat protein